MISPSTTKQVNISESQKLNSSQIGPAASYLEEDGVAAEELQPLHGVRVQRDDGVVVIGGLVHHQPVRRLLPLEDRRREILLPLPAHNTTTTPRTLKSPKKIAKKSQKFDNLPDRKG